MKKNNKRKWMLLFILCTNFVFIQAITHGFEDKTKFDVSEKRQQGKINPLSSTLDYTGIIKPTPCPTITISPSDEVLTQGTTGVFYNTELTQKGAIGSGNFAITSGSLPSGLTLSSMGTISGKPTSAGLFNFTVTVTDINGCTGSKSYSVNITCSSNPIVISNPIDNKSCRGSVATFSTTISNSTNLQWQVDEGDGFKDITNGILYAGAKTSTLTINGVTPIVEH